jgi:hypothetical protein
MVLDETFTFSIQKTESLSDYKIYDEWTNFTLNWKKLNRNDYYKLGIDIDNFFCIHLKEFITELTYEQIVSIYEILSKLIKDGGNLDNPHVRIYLLSTHKSNIDTEESRYFNLSSMFQINNMSNFFIHFNDNFVMRTRDTWDRSITSNFIEEGDGIYIYEKSEFKIIVFNLKKDTDYSYFIKNFTVHRFQ